MRRNDYGKIRDACDILLAALVPLFLFILQRHERDLYLFIGAPLLVIFLALSTSIYFASRLDNLPKEPRVQSLTNIVITIVAFLINMGNIGFVVLAIGYLAGITTFDVLLVVNIIVGLSGMRSVVTLVQHWIIIQSYNNQPRPAQMTTSDVTRCATCQYTNPDDAVFCTNCGNRLPQTGRTTILK